MANYLFAVSPISMSHAGKALLDPYRVFEAVNLGPGMRVADLGCGRTGHFVFPSSKLVGETGVVYAVDIIKDILETIRSRARSEGYLNVQTVWANIEADGKTAIPGESLDVCFITNILSYLKDKTAALREALRLIKSGGYLVVVDWAKKLGPLGPESGSLTSPQEITALVNGLGVTYVSECAPGDYHYAVIFKKT